MSRLRWILVALLMASTALFAAGVIAERSDADEHTEPASVRTQERGESVDAHADQDEAGDVQGETDEAVLGIDVESTPLIVVAVIVGVALAVLAATRFGELAGVLAAIALIAVAWAVLDLREVFHQADESRTGVAFVAAAVAILHLVTAAIAGRRAGRARRADIGSPGRPGTMPA
jgi:Flp pilus assembly protein TadB